MKKSAFVTGCDHGLGLSFAKQLVQRGFVVFAGRYGQESDELDRFVELNSPTVKTITIDIRSSRSVASAVEDVRTQLDTLALPGIDLLINNAAILGDITSTIHDSLDFDAMLNVYNTNTLGTLRVTHGVLPLVERGGEKTIINVSSEAAGMRRSIDTNRTSWYGYCMSKAGVNMQSIIVQNTVRTKGIRVYAIDPGWMKTYMHGYKNEEADFEPDYCATTILETVLDNATEGGTFIDRSGSRLAY